MKHCCSLSLWRGVRKLSALLACVLFTFVFVVSPIKVKATAFPVPPLWLPMNPYNAQGLENNFVLLSDEQKKIVNEVIGAVNIVQLGMGSYALLNPISGVTATREFYQQYGSSFLNTFWSQIMGTSRAMTDFVGSTIYKASTYETYSDFEADTSPSVASDSHKYFQISPELTVAFKNWYRFNGGVEDWQLQVKPWSSGVYNWYTVSLDATKQLTYNDYVSQLSAPTIKVNGESTSSCKNGQVSNIPKYDLFINTSTSRAYFVDSSGNMPSDYNSNGVYVTYDGFPFLTNCIVDFMSYSYSNNFNTIQELVQNLLASSIAGQNATLIRINFTRLGNLASPNYYDIVNKVYVGANWQSREEIFNIDDLNIGSSPSLYIDNIPDTGYVDINTLIGQVSNEVVDLREVVENSVLVKDGDSAIPYAESLQVAIDKFINQPESGVVIPADIFSGLTGASGPVSYLWFMTKPLVSYTGDLLGLLTFDGDGNFQFTGLGYIVVGVVTVGIIGGIITKCLL